MTDTLFLLCLQSSVLGTGLILACMALRGVFRRMPAVYRCILWLLVSIRLLVPYSIAVPYALMPDISPYIYSAVGTDALKLSANRAYEKRDGMTYADGNAGEKADSDYFDNFLHDEANADGVTIHNADRDNTADTDTDMNVSARSITDIVRLSPRGVGLLALIWLAGTAVMLAYMIYSAVRIRLKVRYSVPEQYVTADGAFTHKIYISDEIATPFLFGILRPRIYIPGTLGEKERSYVVRHELMHMKRRDHIAKLTGFTALALHWFNPLVWIAYVLFTRDMEEACDDSVMSEYNADIRFEYANTLLTVASGRYGISAFPVAFGEIPVGHRVEHIVNYRQPVRWMKVASVTVVIILSLSFFTGRTANASQETDPEYTEADVTSVPETEDTGYYSFIPDDEDYCYHVYDGHGIGTGGIVEYSDAVVIEDEADGSRYLLPLYKDYNAYIVMPMDDELETALSKAMGDDKRWYARSLSDYTIETDDKTSLRYIVRNGHRRWEGHVLLYDVGDIEKYDALAMEYGRKYYEIFLDEDVGYSYADMEIKRLAYRYESSFLILQTGAQLQYIAPWDNDSSWALALTTEEYDRLAKWFYDNFDKLGSMWSYEAWKPVFDELDIDYSTDFDTDSPRYRAALDWLTDRWGGFPPEGMSEEQVKSNILNRMKEYDEDGDPIAFGSLPGMTITSEDPSDRHVIIDIPVEYRQRTFDLSKEKFIRYYGIGFGDDTEMSNIYHDYQIQAQKADRLKGTWTLQQYVRAYNSAFAGAVRAQYPDWEPGDEFDAALIEPVTREQVEKAIISDGEKFTIDEKEFR